MKDCYILGLHDGHCATASLMKNGKLIACVSEERFVNKKNESGIPINAINYCLKFAKITSKDITRVILASKFMAPVSGRMYAKDEEKKNSFSLLYKTVQKLRKILYKSPKVHDWFYERFSGYFYRKSEENRKQNIAKKLNISEEKITLQEHHLGHAYTAMYGSGFLEKNEPFLVLTLDGEGDGICSTVSIVKNGKIRRIAKTTNAYSIGLLYLEVTRYLGMKPLEHEYKVMGLAPYAYKDNVKEVYELLKDFIGVKGLKFEGKFHSHEYQKILGERLKLKRFDIISGAIQMLTEELLEKWVTNCIKTTGINKIAFAGGVFMNVKANMKLANIKELKEFFIFPSGGDESLAIGAGYYGYEQYCEKNKIKVNIEPLDNLYLGPEVEDKEILEEFNKLNINNKYKLEKPKNVEKKIAELLSKGEIVARCTGRMEWGARALGNRSILADPSRWTTLKEINEAIKCRDFWMPFAPVIMKEHEEEYIINPKKIKMPYMVLAFDSTKNAEKEMIAAMHPYDKTIRPQILEREWNERYHEIIKQFQKITKRGVLLNTSFNLHGYPIAKGAKEALFILKNSGLKYLSINNYLVSKLR